MTSFVLLLFSELGGEDCLVQCNNQTQENILKMWASYAREVRCERFDSLEDVRKYDEEIHLKYYPTTDNMIPSKNYLTTFSQFITLNKDFEDFCKNIQ